jgi:hypothetical protein
LKIMLHIEYQNMLKDLFNKIDSICEQMICINLYQEHVRLKNIIETLNFICTLDFVWG